MALELPADKSIAHRALLLACLSPRPSLVEGAGSAADVRSTLACLAALGAVVEERTGGLRLAAPVSWPADAPVLDAGNSGTTARLLAGFLAGRGRGARIIGDASLSRRPMARVAGPLRALFTRDVVTTAAGGTLPLVVTPAPFSETPDLTIDTLVASAQVKSAVLFAALARPGVLTLREPERTRDHTERLLKALGADLALLDDGLRLIGPTQLSGGFSLKVPRDPSAAALLAVASLGRQRVLSLDDIGLNPTRTAFLDVLERMGASIEASVLERRLAEPVGSLVIAPPAGGVLAPVTVTAAEAPALIDEIPALAALAALAPGRSRFEGLGELRLKESDRLASLASNLTALGARARVEESALIVEGGRSLHGAPLDVGGDHRMEMALYALAAGADLDLAPPQRSYASVSFPGFERALRAVVTETPR